MTLVEDGQARAYVLVRADAGVWELKAAQDLSTTVAKMTGVTLPVVHQQQAGIPIVVGQLALPRLASQLRSVVKEKPVLRCDAIALECSNDGVFLAGSNDDSHYFAVAELMRRWGCRWYVPTDFGECTCSPEARNQSGFRVVSLEGRAQARRVPESSPVLPRPLQRELALRQRWAGRPPLPEGSMVARRLSILLGCPAGQPAPRGELAGHSDKSATPLRRPVSPAFPL